MILPEPEDETDECNVDPEYPTAAELGYEDITLEMATYLETHTKQMMVSVWDENDKGISNEPPIRVRDTADGEYENGIPPIVMNVEDMR